MRGGFLGKADLWAARRRNRGHREMPDWIGWVAVVASAAFWVAVLYFNL